MSRRMLGRYIVADDQICHGKPTFVGTRILVADVLEMVAMEMDWDEIVRQWRGSISKEGISEAMTVASRAFLEHANEYTVEGVEPIPA